MFKFQSVMLTVLLFFIAIFSAQTALASDAKTYHFGFKKAKNGELASIDQEGFKPILQKHKAIFMGDTSNKELYLTFDNGYENGYTAKILDVLKEKGIPAAFFITGHYIQDQPELVKRMVNEGHLIGNHSWNHPDMTRISKEKMQQELDQVKTAVTKITGQQSMVYLRPPRGVFNEQVLTNCLEFGYTNVFWSIAYKDWDVNSQKGAQYARQQVVSQLHPGAVILLHTVSKDNADSIASIIDDARGQGYVFKSLDEMLVKTY